MRQKKRITKYYEKASELVREYTDILNIAHNLYEMEKMKFLLLDEDQVAIFNLRNKLEIERNEETTNKFSKFYYHCKDLNDSVDINQIRQALLQRKKSKQFNKKLAELIV